MLHFFRPQRGLHKPQRGLGSPRRGLRKPHRGLDINIFHQRLYDLNFNTFSLPYPKSFYSNTPLSRTRKMP